MTSTNGTEMATDAATDDFATDEARIFRLSAEDQRAFAEAILNPPPPSPGLRHVFEAYRKLIKESR